MNDSNEDADQSGPSAERKFLHDIATPIASMRLLAKRLLAQMEGERPPGTKEESIALMKHIVQATNDLSDIHAVHKDYLYKNGK